MFLLADTVDVGREVGKHAARRDLAGAAKMFTSRSRVPRGSAVQ